MNRVVFFPQTRRDLKAKFRASHDVLDTAELLRLTAISMRDEADKLDRMANEIDPQPETPDTDPLPSSLAQIG